MNDPGIKKIVFFSTLLLLLGSTGVLLGNFTHYSNVSVSRVKARASSTLIEKGRSSTMYSAVKAYDFSLKTSWCEGSKGPGVGEYIELSFSPFNADDLAVMNGVAYSPKLYKLNNRVKDYSLVCTLEDGTVKTINGTFPDDVCSGSACTFKGFDPDFGGLIRIGQRIKKIKLVIRSVYRGEKFNDTCITEMRFIKAHYSGG
jgi:hypothetical protein